MTSTKDLSYRFFGHVRTSEENNTKKLVQTNSDINFVLYNSEFEIVETNVELKFLILFMVKFKEIINNKKFHRFFYIACLLLFSIPVGYKIVYYSRFVNNYLCLNSSLGIPYYVIYFVPVIILLYQIIFDNFFGWSLILILNIIHLFVSLDRTIESITMDIKYHDYIEILSSYAICILFICSLFLVKPKSRNKPQER